MIYKAVKNLGPAVKGNERCGLGDCYYLTVSPNAFNMGLLTYGSPCLAHSDFTRGGTL